MAATKSCTNIAARYQFEPSWLGWLLVIAFVSACLYLIAFLLIALDHIRASAALPQGRHYGRHR